MFVRLTQCCHRQTTVVCTAFLSSSGDHFCVKMCSRFRWFEHEHLKVQSHEFIKLNETLLMDARGFVGKKVLFVKPPVQSCI